ncbi:MAG: hypothetical protein AAFP97_00075 [Pseudomonadota bacterium]
MSTAVQDMSGGDHTGANDGQDYLMIMQRLDKGSQDQQENANSYQQTQ